MKELLTQYNLPSTVQFTVTRLPSFMVPETSLQVLQKLATLLYTEPAEYIQHLQLLYLQDSVLHCPLI
jgi:hypothetical protein